MTNRLFMSSVDEVWLIVRLDGPDKPKGPIIGLYVRLVWQFFEHIILNDTSDEASLKYKSESVCNN